MSLVVIVISFSQTPWKPEDEPKSVEMSYTGNSNLIQS